MNSDLPVSTDHLWIGSGNNGGATPASNNAGAPFSGSMDEFLLYNVALSDAQVTELKDALKGRHHRECGQKQ